MEIQEIFNNKNLNVLQTIFETLAEELAEVTELDKNNLSKSNKDLDIKYEKVKQEIKKIKEEDRKNITKYFMEYLDIYDYINAYHNQKYFKEGVKIGIKLIIECIK